MDKYCTVEQVRDAAKLEFCCVCKETPMGKILGCKCECHKRSK